MVNIMKILVSMHAACQRYDIHQGEDKELNQVHTHTQELSIEHYLLDIMYLLSFQLLDILLPINQVKFNHDCTGSSAYGKLPHPQMMIFPTAQYTKLRPQDDATVILMQNEIQLFIQSNSKRYAVSS
uniref:Uncharacterized protein n=1 Tax=Glossina pallidipes TaxID=7398 RepID=A0A1A9Z226_GLOPL